MIPFRSEALDISCLIRTTWRHVLACVLYASVLSVSAASAAEITGRVVDPDGRPTSGARVVAVGPLGVVRETATDETGRFRLADLEAGRYELHALRDGFRADPFVVELGPDDASDVRIELQLSAVTESIVVTAAQVDQLRSRTSDSVTVIGNDELRARQLETVADALRGVAGLGVTQSGGRGGITSLLPRGGESDFTLVLIDGVRMNSFGGGFDFAHLPIAEVERIEVVRGPQSAIHGSDAIGAVVHVVTRQGGAVGTDVTAEGGGFGTTRFAAATAGSAGRWSWGGAAERLSSDGFRGLAPATGERVSNDDYDRTDVSASAAWQHPRGSGLRSHFRFGTYDRGFPGPFGSNPAGFFAGVDRVSRGTNDTRSVMVSLTHPWTTALQQRVDFSVFDLDSEFTSPFGTSESGTRRVDFRVQADAALPRGLGATVGVEVQRERAHSSFIVNAVADTTPVGRQVIGSFGEARLAVAGRLFLTGGFRLEHIERETLDADPFAFQPRPFFASDAVVSANPKLSAAFFLQPADRRGRQWTRLRIGAGTGIRPPNAFEIAFTDNPALKPERSRSIDGGIEQAVLGGALVVELTAFANRYDDLIVAVGQAARDASRFRTDNISNARARGLELSGSWRTPWGLEGRAAYTWMDTEILALDRVAGVAPSPFQVGDALLRRPRHRGSLDMTYVRSRFTSFLRIGGRGRIRDVEPSFGTFGGLFDTPGYVVVATGGAFVVHPGIEVTLRVQNLFDRAYEETLGFPALGRSVLVGVRLAHRR